MRYIITLCMLMISSIVYAEPITNIQIEEWDDVFIITNGDKQTRIDCVPDEDHTPDIVGFCNPMYSTYYYCDQECMIDKAMQDPAQHI